MGEPVRRLCLLNTLVQYAAYPAYIPPFSYLFKFAAFVMKDFWIAEWGGLGIIRFRSFCWGRRFTFFSFDVSCYLSGSLGMRCFVVRMLLIIMFLSRTM
jgi:hypothetical protein